VLHLPSQFTILSLLGFLLFARVTGDALKEFAGRALLIGAIGIPVAVVLTKLGIHLKYRLHVAQASVPRQLLHGRICRHDHGDRKRYLRLVGVLTVRSLSGRLAACAKGTVRWLPDTAIQSGTVEEATALVRAHLSMRLIDR
jgi:hypothetical protein